MFNGHRWLLITDCPLHRWSHQQPIKKIDKSGIENWFEGLFFSYHNLVDFFPFFYSNSNWMVEFLSTLSVYVTTVCNGWVQLCHKRKEKVSIHKSPPFLLTLLQLKFSMQNPYSLASLPLQWVSSQFDPILFEVAIYILHIF